jgi:hypothetical protein
LNEIYSLVYELKVSGREQEFFDFNNPISFKYEKLIGEAKRDFDKYGFTRIEFLRVGLSLRLGL